jgi:UPF0755 protein
MASSGGRERTRSASRTRRWLQSAAAAAATLAALGLVAAGLGVAAYALPGPSARSGVSTTVILPHGAGVSEVAGDLARAGVIRSSALFIAAAEITRAAKRLKAGEYAFPTGASLAAVIGKLRSGDVVHHRITVPEGLTSAQVVDILNASDILTGQAPVPPEGAIMPDTYEVTRGEQRSSVLQAMMDERDDVVNALWARRRPGLPVRTVDEAVTLASIVEKETAVPSERPRIAAVYVNRLRQGMRLQADPTVIYGVTGGAPLGRGLTRAELEAPSPYNTYRNAGLPPGPIGNPGRAALAAVMDPPATNELYFVADGTGGHAFAATLDVHQRNVDRWRQIERSRAAPPSRTARAG